MGEIGIRRLRSRLTSSRRSSGGVVDQERSQVVILLAGHFPARPRSLSQGLPPLAIDGCPFGASGSAVAQDGPGGVQAGGAHDAAAGMRRRAAQVESLYRSAIVGK